MMLTWHKIIAKWHDDFLTSVFKCDRVVKKKVVLKQPYWYSRTHCRTEYMSLLRYEYV